MVDWNIGHRRGKARVWGASGVFLSQSGLCVTKNWDRKKRTNSIEAKGGLESRLEECQGEGQLFQNLT